LYFEAWNDCTTERQIGFGVGPIPWGAVMRWCEVKGVSSELTESVWQVIRRVDGAMQKRWSDERTRKQQSSPSGGKGQSKNPVR